MGNIALVCSCWTGGQYFIDLSSGLLTECACDVVTVDRDFASALFMFLFEPIGFVYIFIWDNFHKFVAY